MHAEILTKSSDSGYDISKFVSKHMFVIKNIKELNSVTEAFSLCARKYSDLFAIKDDYSKIRLTFKEAYDKVNLVIAALQALGLEQGKHIAIFSENTAKWMLIDQAILACGAVNAVRGSLAPFEELRYIYEHSDSRALVTDSIDLINKVNALSGPRVEFVIYIGNEDISNVETKVPLYSFEDLVEMGKDREVKRVKISREDLATLVYSSGTTGKPKGIMLTHGNLVSQLINLHPCIVIPSNQHILSVLPIWHMYERMVEYYVLYCGSTLCYTNIRNFKKDMKKYRPDFIVGVPRLWESIYEGIVNEIRTKSNFERGIFYSLLHMAKRYRKVRRLLDGTCIHSQTPRDIEKFEANMKMTYLMPAYKLANKLVFNKIRKALGGKFPKCISGGGALAPHVEDFFDAANLQVVVGYGLTETSPILTARQFAKNKMYSAGYPINETEIAIVDPDKLTLMPKGQRGLVLAKGPQIMKGYYKDKEATDSVLLKTGWFITGDLGWVTEDNCLILTGRAKDLIVLSNGENIEPDVIEQTCMMSDFVKQIVLVGQDKSSLGALIKTDEDAMVRWAQENGVKESSVEQDPAFKKMLLKELNDKIASRNNYRAFERISDISFVSDGFTIENGLMTFTAKIRKNLVFDKYERIIEEMYK